MPVNQAAMKSMKSEYGSEKGERVYYASVNKGKVKEEVKGPGSRANRHSTEGQEAKLKEAFRIGKKAMRRKSR